ncbi:MAG: SRPBCC family protein [Pseudomonadota bacterium]
MAIAISDKPAAPGGPVGPPQDSRRQALIEATIEAIATYGLSRTTSAKVAGLAGLTAGTVNFHFAGKQDLLLATLKHLADEYGAAVEAALAVAGSDPATALEALIEVNFDPEFYDAHKVAVWYAFWSEARARQDYQAICGTVDQALDEAYLALCRQIIDEAGAEMDAKAIARGLTGQVDSFWQDLLVSDQEDIRATALRSCRAYLASVFPWRFKMPDGEAPAAPAVRTARSEQAPVTLPAWSYDDPEFFALEREAIHRSAWHVLCHVSELPEPGDYRTLELLGERVFAVRGKDGKVRTFHNVCRHRAHAVVEGEAGRCPGVIRCPYHGWSYDLDGRLKTVAAQASLPDFDRKAYGLAPIEQEIFLGFVFFRLQAAGPSVAERLAPFAQELEAYQPESMAPTSGLWHEETGVDWKNVWDNYLENYHFPTGHPGLFELTEPAFESEAKEESRVVRLSHALRDKPGRGWSVRHYQRLLPDFPHLPARQKRRWSYIYLHPAIAFDLYPDKIDYFQVIPCGPGKSVLRSRSFAVPDARREARASRYLNLRINRRVQSEDNRLIQSVQKGLGSSSYSIGLLSEQEAMLRAFQDWVRAALPVTTLAERPEPGTLAVRNKLLRDA